MVETQPAEESTGKDDLDETKNGSLVSVLAPEKATAETSAGPPDGGYGWVVVMYFFVFNLSD